MSGSRKSGKNRKYSSALESDDAEVPLSDSLEMSVSNPSEANGRIASNASSIVAAAPAPSACPAAIAATNPRQPKK